MMRKKEIYFILIFASLIIGLSLSAFADTGTYKILDYRVKLIPHSDGIVEIEYYQKWLVTGGHIPWITVGTANSGFQIDQSKNQGNIRSVSPWNSSYWKGVRIDLDKDYLPNETFEVGFSITQSHLFYVDKDNFKLDFTPGWYGNAITERLVVIVHIFAPIEQVTFYPEATKIEGQEIIWEKLNLAKNEQFPVSISFPKTYFPQASNKAFKSGRSPTRILISTVISWLFILFVFAVVIYAIVKVVQASRYGRGGRIYAAGSGGASAGRSGRSTGGGGGFGGRSSSCACACVSCACACACAGGGGAGCSKKINHTCPICAVKE